MERVFVYGTLKRGFWNHHLLEQCTYLGEAVTLKEFALYVDTIPFVIKDQPVSRICGEVYEVDEQVLMRLDQFEGHPHWYRREKISVLLEIPESAPHPNDAWVYFYPDSQGVLVESGRYEL